MTSALRQSVQHVKKTTGIVGLDVVPNAKEVLTRLYEKTLSDIKIIPEGVAYREQVEKFTKHRLSVVQKHDDIWEIEKELALGQVEELIEEAKGELVLIPEYASWKYWEQPTASPDDDEFSSIYDDLAFIDPDSLDDKGLKDLALKKRAEVDARRRAQSAAGAAAAAAAAGAAIKA